MRGWSWYCTILTMWMAGMAAMAAEPAAALTFPRPLTNYSSQAGPPLEVIKGRVAEEQMNLWVTLLFFAAIAHTFLAPKIMQVAHRWRHEHQLQLEQSPGFPAVSFKAEVLHFLGELEAVFAIWCVPLFIALTLTKGWPATVGYVEQLSFAEPVFVVVIMSIAATRPVLYAAEATLSRVVQLFGGSPAAWWFVVLTIGPLLGSFITEPGAMTISALLLRDKFFKCRPSQALAYATVGLLFVNISIGGALTNFAAPPILMVAGKWGWSSAEVFRLLGMKAMAAVFLSAVAYGLLFRKALGEVKETEEAATAAFDRRPPPAWVVAAHLLFMAWTVFVGHHLALVIGGFLVFIAFTEATHPHQNSIVLRPALLVGLFLAGLVVHGGLQGWWIQPVLMSLSEFPLMIMGIVLTSFNDNAAITYLAAQVPNLGEPLKYSIVAGAIVGGGLTVIANAPNPAGQSLLQKFFPGGLAPVKLFLGALPPTVLAALLFWLWR